MNECILMIEDEQVLRSTLSARLEGEGYVVDIANDGIEGLEKATTMPFDLIILDIMLPHRSGLDVCRDIRQAGLATPILFLSARHQTTDKVIAFKLGGDDYVTKPFKADELVVRIEALLRRVPIRAGHGVYEFSSIRIDTRRSEVTRNGNPVYLAAREFQLLRYLVERNGAAIPRVELLRSVWGYDVHTLTRTVDVHVASLRNKLETDPKHPALIVTVPGVGYKFVGDRDREGL